MRGPRIFGKQGDKNRSLKSRTHAQAWKTFLSIFLILLLAAPLISEKARAQTPVDSSEFSIIQISDTQHLSSMHPQLWPQLIDWIISNKAALNIQMVVHTGDIVDDSSVSSQWGTSNASMTTLLQERIPYCWDAGNHDQNGSGIFPGNPNGGWVGSQYLAFNATHMRSQPYWVSDINDGKNTAVQFSYGNYNILIINLEFHANQTALNWMTDLITTHPSAHIVVATHSYLNGLQGYGYPYSPGSPDWELDLQTALDKYPNVCLTLSGHYIHTVCPAGDGETSNYIRINTREETFFNRQMAHGDGGVGADSVRIFTFNITKPNDAVIQASTYDIYAGVWKNDTLNLFSFREHEIATATPQPTPTPVKSEGGTPNLKTCNNGQSRLPPKSTMPPTSTTPPAPPNPSNSTTAPTQQPTIMPLSQANNPQPLRQIMFGALATTAVTALAAVLTRGVKSRKYSNPRPQRTQKQYSAGA